MQSSSGPQSNMLHLKDSSQDTAMANPAKLGHRCDAASHLPKVIMNEGGKV